MSLELQKCTISRWDNVLLLREVNETFERNRITHLVGPNGIGKTSLMRCIAGYYPPSFGTITLDGQKISPEIVTYLGHENGLKSSLTPYQNIKAYLKILAQDKGSCDSKIETLFSIFKLKKLSDIPCHYLSHGQKRRVALALFFIKKAQIYLLDEPVNGLDIGSVQDFYAYLEALKKESIIILSDHQSVDHKFDNIISLEKYAS